MKTQLVCYFIFRLRWFYCEVERVWYCCWWFARLLRLSRWQVIVKCYKMSIIFNSFQRNKNLLVGNILFVLNHLKFESALGDKISFCEGFGVQKEFLNCRVTKVRKN